jgi:phosphinothricin acetyltransferase
MKVHWVYVCHNSNVPFLSIRPATVDDSDAINDIYNHYVLTSTCTFHLEPVTRQERLDWLEAHSGRYGVTIAKMDGIVVGWASLSNHRPRPAYDGTVESSVYIHEDFHRRGLGRVLMEDLIDRAKKLGFHTIVAGAEASQSASIGLHEKLGFVQVARFKEVGYKFDTWCDTVFMQLML